MKKFFSKPGRSVLLTVMMGFNLVASAQNGPGGIGTTSGTSHLKLWLRADKGIYSDAGTTPATNGQRIQQWNDQSGNGLNATQGTLANRPVFTTTGFNSFPGISFSTAPTFLNAALNISASALPNITVITVSSYTAFSGGTPYAKLWGHDNGGYNRTTGFDPRANPGPFAYFTGTGVANFNFSTATIAPGDPFLTASLYTPTTFTGYVQGSVGPANNPVNIGAGRAQFTVGAINNLGSEPWQGNIVELIVYDTTLSLAQRINVENYLSAKYNTAGLGNDLYRMDNAGAGNFDYDVTGIQNYSGDPLVVSSARGTGLITLSNASNLVAGISYFIGHDNASLAPVTTDLPAGITSRIGRRWAGTENNGDAGTLDLAFDLPGLTVSDPADLRLLIDRNGNGNFADETAGNGVLSGFTRSGTTYTINANMGDGQRFTIGAVTAFTLPVSLRSIQVAKDGSFNKLQWKTERETGFAYYEVQRSQDAVTFYTIGTVQTSASNSLVKDYAFTDNSPLAANYYRLKMVDQKGGFTYSTVVKMIQTNKRFAISPNPAINIVSVTGLDGTQATIQLLDMNGKLLEQIKTTGLQQSFYLTQYPKGTYHIKVSTTKEQFTETIIKQ